jgi:hypothetical protein
MTPRYRLTTPAAGDSTGSIDRTVALGPSRLKPYHSVSPSTSKAGGTALGLTLPLKPASV